MEIKHAARIAAEKAYTKAATEWKAASLVNDEIAFVTANEKYNVACKHLVAMEMKWPTYREAAQKRRTIALRNRGLDV